MGNLRLLILSGDRLKSIKVALTFLLRITIEEKVRVVDNMISPKCNSLPITHPDTNQSSRFPVKQEARVMDAADSIVEARRDILVDKCT